jgi:hypothetical protein
VKIIATALETAMKAIIVPLVAILGLAACASNRPSDADRLALYEAHAGAPVKQIRNYSAIGWDRVDGEHILLTMRPREVWLVRLSGPCLDWGSGSAQLELSSQTGWVVPKFDRVKIKGSPVTCRIEEIRPVDEKAVRAAQGQLRAGAQGASGT